MSYYTNTQGEIITKKDGKFYSTKPSTNGTVFTEYLRDDLKPWKYDSAKWATQERESLLGVWEREERRRLFYR